MTMKSYRYHPYIDEYIEMVESGQVETSEEVKLNIQLVQRKLSQKNIVIKDAEITEAKEYIERYFPFKLFPFQKYLLACIAGLFYDDDTLVFNEFLIMMGRGAGKNGFIAALAKWLISKQGIRKYNVDIVATSKSQAETSFLDVYEVLEENESKMKKFFSWTKARISFKKTKSELKYYTNNAKTKDGLRPGAVIFDEIHAYESHDNIKVFTSALGKVECPRRFYLTTDGEVRGGVLDHFKEESRLVLNGEVPNSRMFPFICKLDDEEEVHDFKKWEKANPAINYFPHLKQEMVTEYENMVRRSAARFEFMTKRMNIPVENAQKEVATYEDRLATNQPIPDDLNGVEAVGGVDFADVRDFCSVGVLFKRDGKRYWIQHTFIHYMALKIQDINPDIIDLAKEKGLCTIVYDKSIDADRVVNWFIEKLKTFHIKKICMDSYRASILRPKLEDEGFEVEIVRRGPATQAMLAPLIDEMFIKQEIVFGDDPLMRWYVGNVFVDEKGNGNKEFLKIDKEKRKTDGFFAFLHSLNIDDELVERKPLDDKQLEVFRAMSY